MLASRPVMPRKEVRSMGGRVSYELSIGKVILVKWFFFFLSQGLVLGLMDREGRWNIPNPTKNTSRPNTPECWIRRPSSACTRYCHCTGIRRRGNTPGAGRRRMRRISWTSACVSSSTSWFHNRR